MDAEDRMFHEFKNSLIDPLNCYLQLNALIFLSPETDIKDFQRLLQYFWKKI